MPTNGSADRRPGGLRLGLGVAVVAAVFLIGGAQGALGAAAILAGLVLVLRARARRTESPVAACDFLLLGGGDAPIAAIAFRLPDDRAEAAAEILRARGWRTLEPPLNGPLAPVRDVGVELHGDERLWVRDLRSLRADPYLRAEHSGDLPVGWGRAAQESGFVLLFIDDGLRPAGMIPALGSYALLHGATRGSSRETR